MKIKESRSSIINNLKRLLVGCCPKLMIVDNGYELSIYRALLGRAVNVGSVIVTIKPSGYGNFRIAIFYDDEYKDLDMHIHRQKYFDCVVAFAQAYESKSGKRVTVVKKF